MKETKIEWCNHTFNPWIGCTKVSSGCANCYAETQDKFRRWTPDGWGKGKARRRTGEAYWKQPIKWNEAAREDIEEALHDFGADEYIAPPRPRVFCASLADWLDDEVPIEWLADLLGMIRCTPNLDWLLLTKRPENFQPRMWEVISLGGGNPVYSECENFADQWVHSNAPHNVWIGTSVENQEMANKRIPKLLSIPAKVRFLSCEPLLGAVNLDFGAPRQRNANSYHAEIHWVICGGESGPDARPMNPNWARSLRNQCADAGVPFLFKQWGEWVGLPDDADSMEEPWCDLPTGEFHLSGNPGFIEECLCDDGTMRMFRVGKKAAGRLLDGKLHDEFPKGGEG